MKEVDIKKREFFKAVGGISVLSLLTSCEADVYSLPEKKPPVPGAEKWYEGEEKYIKSVCGQCPVNCGIIVRVVEGRAVKIMGNPAASPNRGVLGPKGNSGIMTLYDPDRIKHPLKRVGKRGEGKWEKISWDEAIKIVAQKLKEKVEKGESRKIAILCGRPKGFTRELFERFADVLGTPNFYDFFEKSYSPRPILEAMREAFGVWDLPGFDSQKTQYILSLGSAMFESTCHGIRFARAVYEIRYRYPARRGKIVQVDPFLSATGSQADEWIPIKPGKYDVFALGIANVLISENMYDRDFVEKKTEGFERFGEIAREYTPERVEKETGVPAHDIVRIAREMWNSRPSISLVDERSTSTTNGLHIACLSLCLNALLGSINSPGGLVLRPPIKFSNWKDVKRKTKERKIPFADLPDSDVDTFLFYYMNPVYSEPAGERWAKLLEKADFVVSFSPFEDETSLFADIILPDHTYLERFEDAQSFSSIPFAGFGIRKPVVYPLYDTKNTGDTIILIAKEMGFEDEFYWEDFEEAVKERLKNFDIDEVEEKGWWEDPEKKWADFDKFRFCSHLPPHEPEWKGDGLYLLPYKSTTYGEGSGANIPYLMELSARIKMLPAYMSYETFVEISPELAEKLKLSNFERVYVVSDTGKIKAKVLIKEGVPPDVVLVELGRGHKAFGRFAKGRGANPREIIVPLKSIVGNLALWTTRVKIEKA
ncbi:Polysulfide reductase chain A [bacterium HR19]|nr:Polysulfide reductase chain A [bacterium HR19]